MNLLKHLRYVPKRFALVLAATVATTTVATTLAWGPNRQTYTTAQPADHIVFNSITDNPSVGDERDFVVVKDAANQNAGGWKNSIDAVPGKEYLVRVYVHNNAADKLDLKARNTRVSVALPTNTAKNIAFSGFVSADNAAPKKVWDDAAFKSDTAFNVAYVAGSAKFYNNVTGQAGRAVSDSIVTSTGAQVGYHSNNGVIPGCFKFAGYVTLKVKVQGTTTSDFEMSKSVRKAGEQTWSENVATNPGDKVQYRIKYTNKGPAQQNNVTVKDALPAGVSYVNGSTKLFLGTDPSNARPMSDNISTSGINIGSYAAGGMAMVIFDATVDANDKLPTCGLNTLKNVASIETDSGTKSDDAQLTVTKTCVAGVETIKVCELASKNIIEINPRDFDATKHSRELSKCDEVVVTPVVVTPVVTTPEETKGGPEAIASTGPEALLGGLFGSSALGYAAYSYFQSRRTLLGKIFQR